MRCNFTFKISFLVAKIKNIFILQKIFASQNLQNSRLKNKQIFSQVKTLPKHPKNQQKLIYKNFSDPKIPVFLNFPYFASKNKSYLVIKSGE